MLIDSHCHLNMLDLTPYGGDLGALIEKAQSAGVEGFLNISTTLEDIPEVVKTAKHYKNVWATVGLHPDGKFQEEITEEALFNLANQEKVIGMGETGLDYYYNGDDTEGQQERFRRHIRVAKKLKKPLIIHTRSAHKDTIQIMKEENAVDAKGIMHCFTESWEMAREALDLNFFISFSGIVTFKNADEIREVAKKIPLDRMLIETDAPYLAPVPVRGKKNEPAFIRHTAEYLANLRNISLEELAEKTSENFYRLFGLNIAEGM